MVGNGLVFAGERARKVVAVTKSGDDVVYKPSSVLDIAADKADLMGTLAYVSSLGPGDDQEYSTNALVYAGAWPSLWKTNRFDYFNYSFTYGWLRG